MKKTAFILATLVGLLFVTTNSNAQLLKKLKDKTTGGGSASATPGKGLQNDADEDKADPYLDSKPFSNDDPYGINGIYYSSSIISGIVVASNRPKGLSKFHINYKKNNSSVIYEVSNRHSQYTNDAYKLVEAFNIFTEKTSYKSSKKAGYPEFESPTASFYSFVSNAYKEVGRDGNESYPKEDKPEAVKLKDVKWYVYAPGILVLFDNLYNMIHLKDNPEMEKSFFAHHKPVILYKKEMEAKALALKPEDIHAALKVYSAKRLKVSDDGGAGEDLPRPGGSATSPMFAAGKAQALTAMKKYLADNGMSHFVPEYAYVYNDNPAFGDITMPHPQTGVTVTSGHTITLYIVCKNLKPNQADGQKFLGSKYVFFWVNLAEDVKPGQYNTQNFTGKWYVYNSHTPVAVDDESDPMKYKGK
ncbi:MAG: hypothetical protein RIS73_159 [Bacteroidota bacterium]|jgi:hypothetical protein